MNIMFYFVVEIVRNIDTKVLLIKNCVLVWMDVNCFVIVFNYCIITSYAISGKT